MVLCKMLVSSSDARTEYGVAFPSTELPHPPWYYLYDVPSGRWIFIGRPQSPNGVMDVPW